jgi:site-specific DNA-methyltransferase (adenine-specific)
MISDAYLMDNMEYMATIPDKWFSLAICDPPYGIDVAKMAYTQEDNRPVKQKNGATLRVKKLKYKHGDWDKSPPPQEYFDEVCRISKAQIIFGIEYFEWVGVGSGRIKWIKGVPEGVSFKGYELAYCSLIYDEVELPLLWAGMFQAKSLSDPMIQQGNKQLNEKRIHPTHKPVMLYDSIYRDYLPQGGRVFDPNLGGGSSRIAADKAGNIDFYATEIDPDYFADQEKRFRQYKSQLTLKF